ncbi:LamG-like jellyroll fold domain-containing protein [Candidatus Nanohalococcus occultus]|uniref:LamG domain-containing protein n=1 Tax=Candidatus Nanohalococcus occultus TaxID=2978047 RepID=A0ABY8CGG3_9ARCH|nr:LamG domain-containing protein [Candidatus Nanohaloarchaeota archaeon SVXNc]
MAMKGFTHTLEAIISAILLISTVTLISSGLENAPDNNQLDTSVSPIISEKLAELEVTAIEEDFEPLVPAGYSIDAFIRKTDTETLRLGGTGFEGVSERAVSDSREEWSGNFSNTGFRASSTAISYENRSEDLAAYYRFDGSAGAIREYSGNSEDGLNDGAVRGEAGVFSTDSFEFSGGSATFEDTEALREAFSEAGFTMSFWIKPTADGGSWNTIVAWQAEDADGDLHGARTEMVSGNDDSIYTRFISETEECGYNGHGFWARNNNMGFVPGSWNLYTVTYDGETITEYSNGRIAAQGTPGCELGDLASNITIYSLPNSQKMDEFRVYDRTLTDSEVRELYFTGTDGSFNGSYSEQIDLDFGDIPDKIEVDANVPADTSAELFLAGNSFDLNSGSQNYSLSSVSGTDFNAEFRLSAQNSSPEVSPEISSFRFWVNDTATETKKLSKKGDSVRIHLFSEDSSFNASFNDKVIAENAGPGYYTVRSPETEGRLKYFGSQGVFEVVNQSIKGEPRLGENINSYSFPKYQDSPAEVRISAWR